MVRIAVIGLRGIPDVMGGIETHCSNLLPRLIRDAMPGAMQITVLARDKYVAGAGTIDGVDQIPLWAPRNGKLETIVHTAYALFYARFVIRADVVHLHAVGPGLLAPLARLLGMKLLFTHHGEDFRRAKWGPVASAALRVGEWMSTRFAHRVLTVSAATEKRLKLQHPDKAGSIRFIPNGLGSAPPVVPGRSRLESLGLVPGRYAISVGRLVPEKGHDLLIDAFLASPMAQTDPAWKLVIAGDADHASAYSRKLREKALADDRIVMAGQLSRHAVMALNRAAGLFVLPSRHEGLSIAALEAIAAGAPILLSDIEANRLLGLDTPHYFRSGSVASLAAKLDPETAPGLVPKRFDTNFYSWDTIARSTLNEIDALVGPDAGIPALPELRPDRAR